LATSTRKRSPFWYLLPIFFWFVGGIISYFILKNTDPQKAKRCIIIGIVFSIPLILWMGLRVGFGTENPFYVVSGGSMNPELQVFDVLVVQGNDPFESVKIGDIIVFNRPSGQDRVIVSRVTSITNEDPFTIRTKGDANPTSIPGMDFPITEEEYIGKVAYVIQQVGYITRILTPPLNYIIVSIIVLIAVIIVVMLGIKHRNYIKSLDSKKMIFSSDDTQFWVCPHCGRDTQSRNRKQFCSSCNVYL